MVMTNTWRVHLTVQMPTVQDMDMMGSKLGKTPEVLERCEKMRAHKSHWKVAACALCPIKSKWVGASGVHPSPHPSPQAATSTSGREMRQKYSTRTSARRLRSSSRTPAQVEIGHPSQTDPKPRRSSPHDGLTGTWPDPAQLKSTAKYHPISERICCFRVRTLHPSPRHASQALTEQDTLGGCDKQRPGRMAKRDHLEPRARRRSRLVEIRLSADALPRHAFLHHRTGSSSFNTGRTSLEDAVAQTPLDIVHDFVSLRESHALLPIKVFGWDFAVALPSVKDTSGSKSCSRKASSSSATLGKTDSWPSEHLALNV
jgi:hypothetical protein